jgi:hypothetical protein
MGEYADDAIARGLEELDHFERFKDATFQEQYDEGLVDEMGNLFGDPAFNPGDVF